MLPYELIKERARLHERPRIIKDLVQLLALQQSADLGHLGVRGKGAALGG